MRSPRPKNLGSATPMMAPCTGSHCSPLLYCQQLQTHIIPPNSVSPRFFISFSHWSELDYMPFSAARRWNSYIDLCPHQGFYWWRHPNVQTENEGEKVLPKQKCPHSRSLVAKQLYRDEPTLLLPPPFRDGILKRRGPSFHLCHNRKNGYLLLSFEVFFQMFS